MALLLAALLASPTGDAITVPLEPKTVRSWTIALPTDPFTKVSGKIPVGTGFAVERRGVGLAIDTDADGTFDRVIEGRLDPDTKVRHARVMLESDHARHSIRLEDRGDGWTWATSGLLRGAIDGTPIELIDLDGNGRFDDVGRDALVVGGTDVAQFLGETISVDGSLWSVDFSSDAHALQLAPYDGPSGTLDLHGGFDGKGVLLAAVVTSVDGKHSFELSQHEEGLRVPTGRYRVATATLGLGDARVDCETESMTPIHVQSDANAQLSWGGPVKARFKFSRAGGELKLDPNDIHYVGRAGERWIGWSPIGKSPEFHVKDALTGDVLVDAVFPGSC